MYETKTGTITERNIQPTNDTGHYEYTHYSSNTRSWRLMRRANDNNNNILHTSLSTFFTLEQTLYEQINGTPMVSPISSHNRCRTAATRKNDVATPTNILDPICGRFIRNLETSRSFAYIFMAEQKEELSFCCPHKPLPHYRYIDDIYIY